MLTAFPPELSTFAAGKLDGKILSPLFTSVLFNHYSTNAADGYLSA
jgi:hypothetical protein